jgi:ubiquinone/menaquinone biosynthesis C-methylase UbiE
MSLTTFQWHRRYQQQACWTQRLRNYLYEQVGIQHTQKILDIGCGTGVLENELNQLSSSQIFGLDIDLSPLRIAIDYAPKTIYTIGDGLCTPYQPGIFDITMCHFLLLWVKEPQIVVEEMVRVTRPGGFVLALAEPDYGGRIDYPLDLSQIGLWQTEALRQQKANPFMGRELRSIFSQVGLENIEVGVLGGRWGEEGSDEDIQLEWEVLQSDLQDNSEFTLHADKFKSLELASRRAHQRILFVPTFYALGKVKG